MLTIKKNLSYGALAAAIALAGCSSKTKLDDQANAGTGVPTTSGQYDPNQGSQSRIEGLDIPVSSVPGEGPVNVSHVIYFDFDSYTVKPEYQSTLQAHADFLRAQGGMSVALEGHTDERGGREYNLALGQRRAEAVLQTLGVLGVPTARVEAVSYGKEKPKAMGHSEEAHAENRRVEIRYNK
ncbi:peptidoglycan-associated lipoprotein Pal [Vandammella animalimorsus]|uniref:Peptidoglycan-associated lipoprotein n=1 Tax=Vandammella animalimorsus TaxID=2029117 RepID=A0A2A2A907_9BURK|nr:peptidoglycan-associated lipoprotein Pal [Vandammella animalimorsus]PAT34283.1 peptidoglycan-associated lipoprotein [Vandammella animalimorsus]